MIFTGKKVVAYCTFCGVSSYVYAKSNCIRLQDGAIALSMQVHQLQV
jgi:hypothetical protein